MSNERQYDIDWLRVLAMGTVFVFHCCRFFDTDGWHVKNPRLYGEMDIFIGFLVQWMMPLFFVLSGISSFYALSLKGTGQFVEARLKRLGIPFVLGTFILLIPVQVYIERTTGGQFSGTLWQFYPEYFKGWYGFGGNFAWMGLHLWYLQVLLVFSLVLLPLLLVLKKPKGEAGLAHMVRFFCSPGGLLLLATPLIMVEILVSQDPDGVGMRSFGGWSVLTYLCFFLLGYILAFSQDFKKGIIKNRYFFLLCGVVITVLGVFLLERGAPYNGVLMAFLRSLNSWCWILGWMGLTGRYLIHSNKFLRYANTAVLPFYILHQSVIVVIAFFLIKWEAGVGLKLPVLGILSFAGIMLIYEFGIRRFSTMRFLFGLKNR